MLANIFTKTTRDRWKGTVIAAFTLAALFFFGMAVYRDVDLALYTSLPEVARTLMNIPGDADVASLAYGAIYGSYGALTIAALAISMGSVSIAGEERSGTIGLLLGNPKSRTTVLISKTASLIFLTGLGILVLWIAGIVAPTILDVSITGVRLGAFLFHMFVMALFFGLMATAIGAWTGSPGAASGITAGFMFVSFVGAGVFPIIVGYENLARVFPWYYFDESQPLVNGVDWGDVGVLVAGTVIFGIVAVVGVNHRDLKSQTVAVTLLDRLRGNALTHTLANRLAGSARVSKIWVKTASEHQGLLFATSAVMFFLMGVMIGPIYTFIDDTMLGFLDEFPETLLALFGGGDMSTPEGWYQLETFGMMAPIAVMVVTVAIGSRALAGEEEHRTMGLLLANPVKRSTVVYQKAFAMVAYAFGVGIAIFAGVAVGSLLGGLGMDVGNIAATSLLVTLVGLAFGAFSLLLSAGSGRVKAAVYGTAGMALVLYVLNAFAPFSESLAGAARISPFYYYLGSDPLNNGMDWTHGAVLTVLCVVLIVGAAATFQRQDLRQTG
jgi:ABC-2 type transport system permease protein